MPYELSWDQWADPQDGSRWVLVLYSLQYGDKFVLRTFKNGF